MKRAWPTYIVLAVVVGLLTLFLGLQYNWLKQASEAEQERMQRRVESDTKAFAEDFNREIQAAYFNFQPDSEKIQKGDMSEFAERYDFWKGRTAYPELIDAIIYVPANQTPPQQFDPAEKIFGSIKPNERADKIIEKIKQQKTFPQFDRDQMALVVPIYDHQKSSDLVLVRSVARPQTVPDVAPTPIEMPKIANVLVLLNEATIKEKMLPEITAKHFPDGNFTTNILAQGDSFYSDGPQPQTPDASADLFDLKPNNLIFFAAGNPLELPRKETGTVVDQRIESRTITRSGSPPAKVNGDETFTVQVRGQGVAERRTTVIAGKDANASAAMTLNVAHQDGSIAAFVNAERTKSMLIGLGVYLLLAGSIVAIVVSAMRSRAFAQRQVDFVSSVSHEFRTPLAVIYSAGENLADGIAKDESQVERYGNLIKGEGKKLSAMVEQILEFAGARSGKRKYNFASADAAEITREAVAACSVAADEKDFVLDTSIPESIPLDRADAEALSRAIQNLVTNSIKYSNGSRWALITVANGGGTVKISVEDRGIGISPADAKKIFEPFYRSSEVVDAQIHGNGLGLSLVKEIAEAHGGSVSVTSEIGKGSKFTIEVPQG